MIVSTLKRLSGVGATVIVVGVLLVAATAVIPRSFLLYYLGGWFVTLLSINVKHAVMRRDEVKHMLFLLDGVALFVFVFVGFSAFTGGALETVVAAVVGIAAVAYSLSL